MADIERFRPGPNWATLLELYRRVNALLGYEPSQITSDGLMEFKRKIQALRPHIREAGLYNNDNSVEFYHINLESALVAIVEENPGPDEVRALMLEAGGQIEATECSTEPR